MLDIIQTAQQVGTNITLLKAVDAAGLTATLQGPGPFTLFAPTDTAFANLPEGTLPMLMDNQAQLSAVLTYHILSGRVLAADLMDDDELTSIQGQPLTITHQGGVRVNQAHLLTPNIECSNGLIHIIDGVLMPGNDGLEIQSEEMP